MKLSRFFSACLLAVLAAGNASAQGVGFFLNGKKVEIKEGDVVNFTDGQDGKLNVAVNKDGKISVYQGSEMTFFGDIEQYLAGIHSAMHYMGNNGNHYEFGYGSIMHIRDLMTADQFAYASGYGSHFYHWARNDKYIGSNYIFTQAVYRFFENAIHATNLLLAGIDESTATDKQKQYLGIAYAYRAMLYLDMARMYEYLPCDATLPRSNTGKDITGLTVPIITEKATDEEISQLTRATRQEMYTFILSDITKAKTYLQNYERTDKQMPDLACAYGLQARLYMWVEDYENAAVCARRAINLSGGTPLNESEMLDINNGFNSMAPTAWMWGAQPCSYDNAVTSAIINWTSWMSNEATFGYAAVGPFVAIAPSLYNEMGDGDIRKKLFKVTGNEPHLETGSWPYIPAYASLKFRPYQGEYDNYKVGAQSAYPLMRVEEMYLIEAEATAHGNPSGGAALLMDFMNKYRDASYNLSADSINEYTAVNEIVKQKRVELWGEGQTFFDIKRLNMPVDRTKQVDANYISTNEQFSTYTRPAWMNMSFVVRSGMTYKWNTVGEENPDPSDLYIAGGGICQKEQTFNVIITENIFNEMFGDSATATEARTVEACPLDSLEGFKLKAPFNALADSAMGYDGTDLEIRLDEKSHSATIQLQYMGFNVNGNPVYIQSVKDGEYADGIIRFPSNTISVSYLDEIKILSHATEIRLQGCPYNPAFQLYVNFFSNAGHQTTVVNNNGRQYLRSYISTMKDLDEVRIACVPQDLAQSALERLKHDISYGAVAYGTGWVDIPMYDTGNAFCYVCVGLHDGAIQYTYTSSEYVYPDYSVHLNNKRQTEDKTGVAVVQVEYYFGPHIDKAYLALVDKYATEDEILELYHRNKLPSMILAPLSHSYSYRSAQIPFPKKYGEYKVVALALSGSKLVKVSEGDYTSETEYFEHPRRELTIKEGKKTIDEDGSIILSFTYNAEEFEGAYVALLQDTLLMGNVWENVEMAQDKVKVTGSGTDSITVEHPDSNAYYTLVICGYEDGKIVKDTRGNRSILSDPWTPWCNSKDEWVAAGMNAEEWPLGDDKSVTCTYTYTNYYSGDDPGLKIYYRQSIIDATQAQFKIEHWGTDMDFFIEYNPETSMCQVLKQYVTKNNTYGSVYISDIPNYSAKYTYQQYPCYYDKAAGKFTLTTIWFVDAGVFGNDPEYIQVDGFYASNDSVSASYDVVHAAKKRNIVSPLRLNKAARVDIGKRLLPLSQEEKSMVRKKHLGNGKTLQLRESSALLVEEQE